MGTDHDFLRARNRGPSPISRLGEGGRILVSRGGFTSRRRADSRVQIHAGLKFDMRARAAVLVLTRQQWLLGAGLILAGILYLSISPQIHMPGFGLDKLGHIVAYLALMLSVMHVCARNWWPLVGLLCTLLAVALEVVQYLGGHRTFSIGDMVASAVGVALAYAIGMRRNGGRTGFPQ